MVSVRVRRSISASMSASVLAGSLLALLALSGVARAAELVMFERPGCAYCRQFDAEIAPIYDRTEEGRRAPLRRATLSGGLGALFGGDTGGIALAAPVRYAPTFVLVESGREVGRITGYMSQEAFWGLLDAMTRDLTRDLPARGQPATARN